MRYHINMKHSILLVDDESDNLDALERLFRKKFKVLKALGGPAALKLLQDENPAVIISDQRMPEMQGVEFLKKSIDSHPNAIRVLLTGYTDIDSVISAINSGEIYKYVTKPWDPIDLLNTVEKAAEKFTLRAELKHKNQQLEDALHELKALDEAKSSFMILINHELKTPLTVISMYLQFLKESKLTEDQQTPVERIQESYDRLELLINDSLKLVEAETGQVKTTTKSIGVNDVLKPITTGFTEAIKSKNLTLKTDLEIEKVKTDPNIFNDVLLRLLDNAVKFADNDSIIAVECKKNNDKTQISITSTGKKLDAKKIDFLLKPFTLDEKALNHSKGTGLGLAICHSQLKLIESQLEISANGKVTCVSFLI